MATKLKPAIKARWVEALRSGEFELCDPASSSKARGI